MSIKSFLKRLIFGSEIVDRVNSEINGEILVTEDLFGRREMIVGKVEQSGILVNKLWEPVLKKIHNSQFIIHNSLILGLGAGTLAKLITEKFPRANITGVEIDPKVIEIGKKYFDLDKIPNLKLVVGDAFEFVNDSLFIVPGSMFDLILVDLYLGQEFPKEAETGEFLKNIQKLLAKDGLVVFNRLYFNRQHQEKAEIFLQRVNKNYPFVKTQKAITNLLILASLEAKNKV